VVEREEDGDTVRFGDRGKIYGKAEEMIDMNQVGLETVEAVAEGGLSPQVLFGEKVEWRVERLMEHCARETFVDATLDAGLARGRREE
jgi:hypothetical protein